MFYVGILVISMKFPRADGHGSMRRFFDVSATNSVTILGCAGSLVAPKLMTSCPTVCCVYLCLASHGMECDPSG